MNRAIFGAVAAVALASGCQRDPVWFGYWEITEARRGDAVVADVGTLEVMRNSDVALFLRYTYDGAAFAPDPTPAVELGVSDAVEADIVDGYKEKGEVYTVYLSPFNPDATRPFDVVDFTGDAALISTKAGTWPGRPDDELLPTELSLSR